MRVFIGIKASEEIQKQVLDLQNTYKNLPVRFIKLENLHLTLVPPWYESNIKKLIKNLNKFSFQKTFEITFDSISKGPPRNARLIWLTGPEQRSLKILQKDLAKFLKKPGQKHSTPHITIARFKNRDAAQIPEIRNKIELKSEVSEITLFESSLSRYGAEYSVIETLGN